MKKLLTVLLPALTLTALTACDAEDAEADERMFQTDYDDGDDDDDDFDVLPNDLSGDEIPEGGMDLDAPEAPTPEFDVLDAPNHGDPTGPLVDDGENGETELSPLPEKEWDDGDNAHAEDEGDEELAAGKDYDEGTIAGEAVNDVDDAVMSCEGAGGNTYQPGDVWEEDCNVCACADDGVQCTQMACTEADEVDTPNLCGEYDLGEKWLHDDGCNLCACTEQGIACTAMVCEQEVDD